MNAACKPAGSPVGRRGLRRSAKDKVAAVWNRRPIVTPNAGIPGAAVGRRLEMTC